jgi:hypothetical protein
VALLVLAVVATSVALAVRTCAIVTRSVPRPGKLWVDERTNVATAVRVAVAVKTIGISFEAALKVARLLLLSVLVTESGFEEAAESVPCATAV